MSQACWAKYNVSMHRAVSFQTQRSLAEMRRAHLQHDDVLFEAVSESAQPRDVRDVFVECFLASCSGGCARKCTFRRYCPGQNLVGSHFCVSSLRQVRCSDQFMLSHDSRCPASQLCKLRECTNYHLGISSASSICCAHTYPARSVSPAGPDAK